MPEGVVADHRLSHVSTASSTNSKRTKAHIGPWQLGRTLGRGSSGRVRLAKHNESGKLAAVKIVPKSQIVDPSTGLPSRNSETFGIEREVIIMKLIEHPNIMTLYDVWENKGELYLVLEYIEGGELFDYLISRGRLSEREAIHYFRQICYGVDYCHKFNICHRDLKPENLLLDTHRNIKIADFGMAALESNGRLLETSCGSPHYASPEIVTGKTYHGAPSDIWSCGIILFALLTGHLPFDDDNIRQLLLKVQAGKFSMPSSLSPEARDLISRMLVVNPTKRISMREIFAHPLLAKYPLRRVPIENIDRKTPKIDVTQPITRIDPEILRNLQTLWHHDSREYLINRLKRPEPNTEKTFYSLLLRFRQRHGLSSRESLPRNRSAASIRSLRSSKSVRSLASLTSKPGSMKSLKSVRSNRSGRSLVSRRRARYSPVKSHHHHHHHHHHHKHHAPSSSLDDKANAATTKHPETKNRQAATISQNKKTNDNTDVFAQLLDEAFNQPNSPQPNTKSESSAPVARPVTAKPPASYHSPVKASYTPNQPESNKKTAMTSSRGAAEARAPKYSTRPRDYGYLSTAVNGAYPAPITKSKASHGDRPSQTPNYLSAQSESNAKAPVSLPKTYDAKEKRTSASASTQTPSEYPELDMKYPSINMDFGLNSDLTSSSPLQGQNNNYLLPMIFEEDRFADAIEEEMDLKVYKRKNRSQKRPEPPTHTTSQSIMGTGSVDHLQDREGSKKAGSLKSDNMQPEDNSQLRIHNLVAGESLLSYNPSPAAASIAAPVRPAPRAPSGPRAMSSQHAPAPIYVESDSDSTKEEIKTPGPARKPLAPLSPEDLKRHPRVSSGTTDNTQPQQRQSQQQQQPQQPQEQQLKLPKRGETIKQSSQHNNSFSEHQPKEKKSWIRRLTPRIMSRMSSKHESKPPVSQSSAAATARAHSMPNSDKENNLHGHNQVRHNSAIQGKYSTTTPQRQSSFEEPRQNWFMKFLTASTQTSSRTLMSTCQPIELRAIILEVLSEWMPHGLAAYSDGSRGEPISVAILRNNSLKLKPARISIDIKPSYTSNSSAHLVHESGARSSFFTFAGELERRLGENNVLGV